MDCANSHNARLQESAVGRRSEVSLLIYSKKNQFRYVSEVLELAVMIVSGPMWSLIL